MDFMKALTYPFDDDEWLSKVGLGVLIQLIPVVGSFTLQGWSFEIAKRVKGDDPTPLPDWSDFGDMLVKGLMLAIAGLIYMAPVVVFGCLLWITTLVLGGAVFAADSSQTAGAAGWAFPLLSGCCGCLALIYMIVAVLVYLGGYLRYIDSEEFGTFFQIGENWSLMRENIGDFGMVIVYFFLVSLIAVIGSFITLGLGFLLIGPLMSYFSGHILGQLAQKVSSPAAPLG